MNTTASPLARAIAEVGLRPMATALGISYQAILKWESRRRLPRTEWTGETCYAAKIAQLTGDKVTRQELLAKWPELVPIPGPPSTPQSVPAAQALVQEPVEAP